MAKIDVNREIRRAVDSGKVFFGSKQSEKSINSGEAKLLITTNNTPKLLKEKMLTKAVIGKVDVLEFEGNSLELGQICGKPFNVSLMVIKEAGKSSILKALKEKKSASKQ